MKFYSIQQTTISNYGDMSIVNRGDYLDYNQAKRQFDKYKASNTKDDVKFDIVEHVVDVQTVFEEYQKRHLTSEDVNKSGFESRFEESLGKVIIESNDKAVKGDSALEDMLYNSGEFTIVFQCDDPTKTFATCLPYEAESYNNLVEAIRNFIKNSY